MVEFWKHYPEIDTIENKFAVIRRLEYESEGHFVLPADTWMRDYYEPMELILAEKIKLWEGDPQGQAVIEEAQQEIALYRQYSDYYGYAFFVMQCPQEKEISHHGHPPDIQHY